MFGMCKHNKLSDIKKGYQYCLECNKAFLVPCNHIWIKTDTRNIQYREEDYPYRPAVRTLIEYTCENCGIVKIITISVEKDPTMFMG